MKSASPALLPLLRSRAQGDVTAWIMLHPGQSFSLTDISEAVGVSVATVMREVDRLSAAGFVKERRVGNTRFVQADTENVVFDPLSRLMAVTFGPIPVLREMLGDVEGIRDAYIYGSWAARHSDVPGPVPDDVDVLVIGTSDFDVLDDVAAESGRQLGREVSIRRVRPEVWDSSSDDSFKATVTSRPLVSLLRNDLP